MPLPQPGTFGIVDNPLVYSPFSANKFDGGVFSIQDFLLMDGTPFLLMDGTNFLLMGD